VSPVVPVILPPFNRLTFLLPAVESLFAQTCAPRRYTRGSAELKPLVPRALSAFYRHARSGSHQSRIPPGGPGNFTVTMFAQIWGMLTPRQRRGILQSSQRFRRMAGVR
jgi:hypothetical protein